MAMEDMSILKEFESNVATDMADKLNVDKSVALKILNELIKNDFFMTFHPEVEEPRCGLLVVEPGCVRARCIQMRNIKIAFSQNPILFMRMVFDAVCVIGGITTDNPIISFASVMSAILNNCDLTRVDFGERETAILIALSHRNMYSNYSTTLEKCLCEANEILIKYGYAKMDSNMYSDAIRNLEVYRIIRCFDGNVCLQQKIVFEYQAKKGQ